MSHNNQPTQPTGDVAKEELSIPEVEEHAETVPTGSTEGHAPEDDSTIGTGTSMALGCIAGTVVLIIFGLLFLALSRLI